MKTMCYFRNHFLIAMPALNDANFARTVTLICEHNQDGAMGIIINRPLSITLDQMLQHIKVKDYPQAVGEMPVFLGGPVQQERGFVLHRPIGHWETTLKIGDEVGMTTSRDILDAITQGKGPPQTLIALGYAGWGPHQLEQELAENAWLSTPASSTVVFDTPYQQRWEAAAALAGVDLSRLSGEIGHA
ncbi:YqgE/AlgH family protein [Nitrosococcus watsonii]|nr:YqgE/AlgH family protein [Nitrosococcus watsonii]